MTKNVGFTANDNRAGWASARFVGDQRAEAGATSWRQLGVKLALKGCSVSASPEFHFIMYLA